MRFKGFMMLGLLKIERADIYGWKGPSQNRPKQTDCALS